MLFKIAIAIAILFSVGFVGLIIYANIQQKKSAQELQEVHQRLGLVSVSDYPLKSELEGGGGAAAWWQSHAYQFPGGDLAGGWLIYSSLFPRRPDDVPDQVESERALSGVRRFITVHIPASVSLDDEWLKNWQSRLGQKTPHPRRTLDMVKRVPSGGVAVRWEVEAVSKLWLMTLLKELTPTLPRRAAAST